MEKDLQDLLASIKSIDDDIAEMSKTKLEPAKIPSNLQILASGLTDQIGVPTLFSPKIDEMISKLFDGIVSGNFDKVSTVTDSFEKLLNGQSKAFEGELSKRIIQNITDSVNSAKFQKTKSNIRKALLVLKQLNQEVKKEDNPEKKKKLKDAVYAIKKVMQIVAKIYKQRKKITDRVKKGFNTIVNEENKETTK